MIKKLYSKAHLEIAEKIFSNKINHDWYNCKWTDDEINKCKEIELNLFITTPCLTTYPIKNFDLNEIPNNEIKYLVNFLMKTDVKSFLSIGCGLGNVEMMLAHKFPLINFTAIDNSPYTNNLNKLANDLNLSNITFINQDLRYGNFQYKYDVVYSFAVIYCLEDDELENYFKNENI
uniref:class I SAM-dependent methyltransferase n=1 Tax=Flavobacterium sp. TaxID=239 RepID=UPI004049ABCB